MAQVALASALESGEVMAPEEELFRARLYGLLARLLAAPPDSDILSQLACLGGDASPLGSALTALALAARGATPASVAREYHDLFIGIGRGELVPYGSYYRTGFLNEKPLAELRATLDGLGIARAAEVKEPEDHIAALSEVMAGLITGAYGAPRTLAVQRQFHAAHLAPWAGRFFADLEQAQSAAFYAAIGRVGRHFVELEIAAFSLIE